ncbi:MAG: hypothetical protein K8I03_15210 [Ignavibacteria bacterium]|nr:hypothetical protein [Ignavibacteria bacterium]
MKSVKSAKYLSLILLIVFSFFCSGCGNIHKTPDGAVVAFIVAAEQRDMTKAWNILSPDLQTYYNGLGEKMRKSGRGALENEIAKISRFRSVKKDYSIQSDSINSANVNIITIGGPTHLVETINIDGNFKIKDETSLKNLLSSITAEVNKKEGY